MKKIIYLIIWFLYSNFTFAENSFSSKDDTILKWMLWWIKSDNSVIKSDYWKDWVVQIFTYVKETIFWVLALIVIGSFLYIWYKIIISRGNPEEFKKAWLMLIYAVLWMLFIALSWVIVVFISGLKI